MFNKRYLLGAGLSFAVHALAFSHSEPPMTISNVSESDLQAVQLQLAMVAASKPPAKPVETPKQEKPSPVKEPVTQAKPKPAEPKAVKAQAKTTDTKPLKTVTPKPAITKPVVAKSTVKEQASHEEPLVNKKQTPALTSNQEKPVAENKSQQAPTEIVKEVAKETVKEKITEPADEMVKPTEQATNNTVTQKATQPVLVKKPTFKSRPSPIKYPRLAKRRNQQGEALVEVWLNKYGEQIKRNIIQSTGFDSLDRAALTSIADWQFDTHANDGQTFAYRVQIPVRFKLD